ncbi:MAG: nucleotidyltransferase family protein [Cyanobacteria bacterium P01_H01_bin.15]
MNRQTVIETIEKNKTALSDFRISSLSLFGSTARDEATDTSDLDFLVEFEGKMTFRRYMALKIYLEDLFQKPIDLVPEDSIKPIIRENILEDAIRIA